jgi:hypothetical protein
MTARLTLTAFALGVLVISGCGSGASLEQGCADWANADRTREYTCYGVTAPANEAQLIVRETQACVLNSGATGSHASGDYWAACGAEANNHCAAFQCPNYPPGDLPVGAPCLVGIQCASLWCSGTAVTAASGATAGDAIQCGTCADRLAEGAACVVGTDLCDVGLSCFQGTCRPRASAGGACTSWSDCASPNACKSTGVCGPVAVQGQPCSASTDCTTDVGCDAITKVCVPLVFAQPGGACDGDVYRCEAGSCDLTTNLCPTIIPDGTPCDPSDPSVVCDDYARCFEGVCQIPPPDTCG